MRHNRLDRDRRAEGRLVGSGGRGLGELVKLSARASLFMSSAACILCSLMLSEPKRYCTPTMMSDGRPDDCLASGSDQQILMVQDNRLRMQSAIAIPACHPPRPDDRPTPRTSTHNVGCDEHASLPSKADIRRSSPLGPLSPVGTRGGQPGTQQPALGPQ